MWIQGLPRLNTNGEPQRDDVTPVLMNVQEGCEA
jgi:hypothetical protein